MNLKVDYLKVAGVVTILLVIAFCGYGTYKWYFARPPQTITNIENKHYTLSGENATVNEAPKQEKQKVNAINFNYDINDKSFIVGYSRLF